MERGEVKIKSFQHWNIRESLESNLQPTWISGPKFHGKQWKAAKTNHQQPKLKSMRSWCSHYHLRLFLEMLVRPQRWLSISSDGYKAGLPTWFLFVTHVCEGLTMPAAFSFRCIWHVCRSADGLTSSFILRLLQWPMEGLWLEENLTKNMSSGWTPMHIHLSPSV